MASEHRRSIRAHAASSDARCIALGQRVADLHRQLEEACRERAATAHELEALRFRADHFECELRRVDRERHLTERHLHNITRQFERVTASRSWRVTAPLRGAGDVFRRLVARWEGKPRPCDLQIVQQIVPAQFDWRMQSVGAHPWLRIGAAGVRLDRGWVRIQFRMLAQAGYLLEPGIGWSGGDDRRPTRAEPLRIDRYGYVDDILSVPAGTTAVWLQPCHHEGLFTIEDLRLTPLSDAQAASHRWLRGRRSREHDDQCSYRRWISEFDTLTDTDRQLIAGRIAAMIYTPRISVLMPVYNADVRWLVEAIESVRRQLYPHWELCISDDCSTVPGVRDTLERYRLRDERIKVCYRGENGHISACSNSALGLATGDFVGLLDHDDELREHSLYMVAEALNEDPDVGIVYTDEDKIDQNGQRFDPYFKSEWNPDLFYSHNLISHLGVYRRSLVNDIGGFTVGCEGSQDYDLALRCVERLEPEQIRHIPHVLYHWRSVPGSVASGAGEKAYAYGAARRAIGDHLRRRGCVADVVESAPGSPLHRVRHAVPTPAPLVSLVVPTRDRVDLLRRAIDGILAKTDYHPFEIVILDNGSCAPETLTYFEEVTVRDARVRIVRHEAPFNFSELVNAGVGQAGGDVIALVNNDVDVIGRNWLTEMVSHAVRPDIGVVGAMLYYPDDTVQHAGIALGIGGIAGHLHKRLARGMIGYAGRAHLIQNVSAVTAACCVVRKSAYDEVGGFDERLGVAFNDVDFCLRVAQAGYRNLWTPYAELYHFESATRGSDRGPAAAARLARETEVMVRRYGGLIPADPAYSPNLTLETEDFALAFPPRARRPWRPVCQC